MPDSHRGVLPADVLDDVASVVGAQVTFLSRLAGGINAGAVRVQLGGRADAVLKAEPRAQPNHLDEMLRAQRVVEHMRRVRLSHPGLARSGGYSYSCMASDGLR